MLLLTTIGQALLAPVVAHCIGYSIQEVMNLAQGSFLVCLTSTNVAAEIKLSAKLEASKSTTIYLLHIVAHCCPIS